MTILCPACRSPNTRLLPKLRDGKVMAQAWAFYNRTTKRWRIRTRHACSCGAAWFEKA